MRSGRVISTARRSRPARLTAPLALAVALGVLVCPAVASAEAPEPTITATVTNGHWNDPNTWVPKRVPTGADDVLISTTVLLDPSAVSVHSLQMRGFGFVNETGVLGPWSIAVGGGGLWVSVGNPSELNNLFVPTTVDGPASIGGDLGTDTLTLDGTSTINGAVGVVVNHGSLELNGQISGSGTTPSVNAPDGTITLRGHTRDLTNGGAINVPAKAMPLFFGTLTNEGGGHIDVGGESDLGDAEAESRCSTCSAVVLNGGELTGSGTVEAGVANNGGTVSPGGDGGIGVLRIADGASGYRQGPGGTLRVDVHGSAAGTTMDGLVVGGKAVFGGSLYLDSSGYGPPAGADHPIVTSFSGTGVFEGYPFHASTSGAFASLTGPGAASFEALYPAVSAEGCLEPAPCTGVDIRATAAAAGGGGGGTGGGSTGGGTAGGGGSPVAGAAHVSHVAGASAAGRVGLTISCAGPGACSGHLSISLLTKGNVAVGASGGTRTRTVIGTASYAIPAGQRRVVTVTLSRKGRSLLRAGHGRLKVTLTLAAGGKLARTVVVLRSARGHR